MPDFLTAGFVLELPPDRLLIGWGPFSAAADRAPDQPGCYAPDFYLTEPAPWTRPAGWRELSRAELKAALGPPPAAPTVTWTAPDRDAYVTSYRTVMHAIAHGEITKAVPVLIERGHTTRSGTDFVHALLARALDAPAPSLVYGWWGPAGGIVGASPEVLFHRNGRRIETAALAGTWPAADGADRILGDPKERAEHRTVVDDIAEALGPFGAVRVEPTEVLRLPTMAHLCTPITVEATHVPGFAALVRALHPTAAVGVVPRSAGPLLLPALDAGVDRGRFGAPFGVELPDGRAVCLVAIRNVQWRGATVLLGAGGGVIARSELEREWQELSLKRAAVKEMLGL